MEPHGQGPRSLHEVTACAHLRKNTSLRMCQAFGALSARCGIRRSINPRAQE